MPDQTAAITIRAATPDTFRAFLKPLEYAFGELWGDAELEAERHVAEIDRVIGAFDGDVAVGCSGAYTFRMTVPGGAEVGAAGVTLVGVSPTHRRRGILRMMMLDLFEQARDRGEPVAVLQASEAAIYQKFGYAIATFSTRFEAPKDKVVFSRPVEGLGQVRVVERDEAIDLASTIYDARRPSINGALNRTDAKWRYHMLDDADWMRGANGHKIRAVLEVEGQARAYAIYRIKAEWDALGPKGVVFVLEVLGLGAAAEQAMWQWIFSLDLIGTVKAERGPVPLPLSLMVTEPRRLNMGLGDSMWLRIIDLKAALEARQYRGPGEIVLDVTDDFCPENAGRWRLTVDADGSGSVQPAAPSLVPDLALDIRELAATYLGTLRFGDLGLAGRVVECRPGALADADAMFGVSTAPFNGTPF